MSRKRLLHFCLCLISGAIALAQFDALSADDRPADDKPAEKKTEPRDPAEISRAETMLVRLASKKVDEAQRVKAIVGLCELFVEIGEHPEVDKSVTLQRVSVEVQGRLRGIEERISNELRRRKIPEPQSLIDAARDKRKARSSSRMLPPSEPSPASESSLAESPTTGSSSSDSSANAESQGSATDQTGLGGPGSVDEMGWWLVDLIRHTVQPDYWDTAGGPGTVVYYGPSRALVIRGNWRIHEQVADMLSALR